MRTFFTRRLEPKTRSSYHIKWSNAKWNTLKQNTSSLLKTKLSQNYSTLTQVRSRTKESKLTLHAVVVFGLKQTKQRKHRVGTPSIPSRERTTPREPKFHNVGSSGTRSATPNHGLTIEPLETRKAAVHLISEKSLPPKGKPKKPRALAIKNTNLQPRKCSQESPSIKQWDCPTECGCDDTPKNGLETNPYNQKHNSKRKNASSQQSSQR